MSWAHLWSLTLKGTLDRKDFSEKDKQSLTKLIASAPCTLLWRMVWGLSVEQLQSLCNHERKAKRPQMNSDISELLDQAWTANTYKLCVCIPSKINATTLCWQNEATFVKGKIKTKLRQWIEVCRLEICLEQTCHCKAHSTDTTSV
jgi:hypothetical protein